MADQYTSNVYNKPDWRSICLMWVWSILDQQNVPIADNWLVVKSITPVNIFLPYAGNSFKKKIYKIKCISMTKHSAKKSYFSFWWKTNADPIVITTFSQHVLQSDISLPNVSICMCTV